ncbi:MAG: chemotaxis protein CheX [Desulfuromonadales bacterium]
MPPNEFQLDALKEIVNTGIGKAAASLNAMLESPIDLEVPAITIFQLNDLDSDLQGDAEADIACVQLNFRGSIAGKAALVFPPQSAVNLVAALTGEEPDVNNLNAVMAGTLNEVGNIVINAVIGTIGNILTQPFDFSVPNYIEGKLEELLGPDKLEGITVLLIRTRFRVQKNHIEGNIYLIFEVGSFETLFHAVENLCPSH